MRNAAFLPLFLLAIAGCTDPVQPVQGPEPEPDAAIRDNLHMEGCFGVSLAQAYVPGMNPAPVPDGWSEVKDWPSYVSLWLWECPRVGLDHLERPATLLWETTSVARPPNGCFPEDGYAPSLVLSVLTDDEEVHERLAARGLPVETASFHRTATPSGFRWTWDAGDASSLDIVWQPGPFPDERTGENRWVWLTPDGVGWMDLETTGRLNDFVPSTAQGTFAPSHYVGVQQRFAGVALVSEGESLFAAMDAGGPSCD